MKMHTAILATLRDSGPATFVDVLGATCAGAEDFNVNLLPGVLYFLVRGGKVNVINGVYSLSREG